MADEDVPGADAALTGEEVSNRTFPTAFRGFDPVEVRAFLGRVAEELDAALAREAELRKALAEAPSADAAAEVASTRAQADRAVAEAVERATALEAEAQRRASALEEQAKADAQRTLAEAREESDRLRREAESSAVARTAEAQVTADKLRGDAEKEVAAMRVRAREQAEEIVEAARERGREMVGEAQAARERMMADVAKRKRSAQAQLDQIRVGRDRLLDTLRVARRTIDEVTMRFETSDAASRGSGGPAVGGPVPRRPRSSEVARERAGGGAAVTPAPGPAPNPPTPINRPAIDAPQAHVAAEAVEAAGGGGVAPIRPPIPRREPEAAPPAAAVEPEVDAEPEPPAEERRSSALRILRRGRQAPAPAPAPPRPELSQPPSQEPGEGVRILAPAVEEADEPGAEPPAAPVEAEDLLPESDASPEPPTGDDDVVPEELGPEPAPVEATTRAGHDSEGSGAPGLDDLFARLRADRERAAEWQPGPEPGSEATTERATATPTGDEPGDDRPTSNDDERALQKRDAALEPIEGQLVRRLKRAVQDEQNDALDRLRTNRGSARPEVVLPPADAQARRVGELVTPFLDQAARAGTASAPFGPTAVEVADLAAALASEMGGAMRTRLERALADAGIEGLDMAAISERISSVYREWKGQRVESVARHHLVLAWARGAFVATPEGTRQRWVVEDEGGPCPDCDDNALAGPTPRGEPFPTGQLHPPAHPGCRCLLVTDPG